jgi:polar amino acid transport system substrate-binding protein
MRRRNGNRGREPAQRVHAQCAAATRGTLGLGLAGEHGTLGESLILVEKGLSHSGPIFKVAEGGQLPPLAQLDQIGRQGHQVPCLCSIDALKAAALLFHYIHNATESKYFKVKSEGTKAMHTYFLALVAMAFALCLGNACATEVLKLATGVNAPYTGASLPNGGPLTDIVRRAFAESGYDVEIAFLPWKRGYAATLNGEYVGTFPYVRNTEREKDFVFSEPVYVVTRNLYYLAKSDINPNALSSLKGKQLCVPLGFAVAQELVEMVEKREVATQNPLDLAQCVEMLARGRVDAFTAAGDAGAEATANVTFKADILNKVIGKSEYYLIVPKRNPHASDLIGAFNRGIVVLKKKK